MTEIIFCGTPKRASTVQRRARSMESYALVRSIKHTYNGICFYRANFYVQRITNIMSVVERFGWKLLCSSVRVSMHSQYSLRRRAMIFSRILLACATSEVFAALFPTLLFVEHHDDRIFPLLRHLSPFQIETTISSSPRRRAGSPLRVILNSSTETSSGPTAFRLANKRMVSANSCVVV